MYTFIANPHARSGLGHKIWNKIEAILIERHVNYQVYFTRYQNHATQIVRRITSEASHCTIIVLGGDGTINEVVCGISDPSQVTLGYIPIGSGNDFARGLGLSSDYRAALDAILSPTRFTYLNIGCTAYDNKTRHFAVSSGIGFDADVCHQVVVSRLKPILNKLKLGKLTYVGVALRLLLTLRPKDMTITIDQERTLHFQKVIFAAAMNLCYEGGGFKFCPKAKPDDDRLDLIVISNMSRMKILLLLPTAFKGLHVHFKGVDIYRCKCADLKSDEPIPVHTDGEPISTQDHIQTSLMPGKLRLILS